MKSIFRDLVCKGLMAPLLGGIVGMTLSSCRTQRHATAEELVEVDTTRVVNSVQSIQLGDSLLREFTFVADSMVVTAIPDSMVQIVARGAKLTHRTEHKHLAQADIALRDSVSVRIRDSTVVVQQVDNTAIYKPPELTWFIGLLLLLCIITCRMIWKK